MQPARPPHPGLVDLAEHVVTAVFSLSPRWADATPGSGNPATQAVQLTAYVAHVALGLPLGRIASHLCRDISTIAHGCRSIEARRDDKCFDLAVTMVERGLAKVDALAREAGS